MQDNSSTDKTAHIKQHGLVAKAFHWGFIGLFIYGISKGLDNVQQLADTKVLQFEMIFASLFLLTLGARYLYMRHVGPTALPDDTSVWMKRAARAGHLALYGSLAMIAVSGMVIGALYSYGFTNGPVIRAATEWHEFSLGASYMMIGLHISAALFHRWLGDGIWSSMVPLFKEKATAKTKMDGQ